nr:28S ribosomal protein S27, mitochondrial-like [Onthophagus taurus]
MSLFLRNFPSLIVKTHKIKSFPSVRKFLSQAYFCSEHWEHRLKDPILQKVNVEDFYQDLELRHSKTGKISAIDVDIFANAVKEDTYIEELLDLVHKLRLSADTQNTLNSTSHAVIRYLNNTNNDEVLLRVLDDRLNYGIFLDYHIANLLMFDYYKKGLFANGARVAANLMLQEEFESPLSINLGLLNCYNYLKDPKGWPELEKIEEPEEEVKIRVKYLRNPFDDDHFDLTAPNKIIGKTLITFTKNPESVLEKSLHLLGLILYEKLDKSKDFSNKLDKIHSDILKLIPDDNEIKKFFVEIPQDSEDVQTLLEQRVKDSERKMGERDISNQCDLYNKWIEERKKSLLEQNERIRSEQRLLDVETLKKDLQERETKLWFFENEEKIELEILAKSQMQKQNESVEEKKVSEKKEDLKKKKGLK